ncbi:MAG: site-2 protease family protein [Candidatus Bathyarchaeia archaeon]
MSDTPSEAFPSQPPTESIPFEQIRSLVESEFQVEEGFLEYGVPTFYITQQEDSKKAFLRLVKRLDPLSLVPILRRREEKIVLQAIRKPPTKSSRKTINITLLFATLATVFIAGYFQSSDVTDAVMFTGAIMAILGSHEMGHKIAADKHGVEATYPYFVPGPPPIGTFGAVIQQKSLPPNRDALFDLGSAGPIVGFLVAIAVTIVGVPLSNYGWAPPDAPTLPVSILFEFVARWFPPLGELPPRPDPSSVPVVFLHPVAFAGWVGMIVTVLNLLPVGMFDGGHIARTFLGERIRTILSYLSITAFLILGLLVWEAFLMWAVIAIFFAFMRHPGPLDDASKVTTGRKLAALGMVAIFFLSFPFLI